MCEDGGDDRRSPRLPHNHGRHPRQPITSGLREDSPPRPPRDKHRAGACAQKTPPQSSKAMIGWLLPPPRREDGSPPIKTAASTLQYQFPRRHLPCEVRSRERSMAISKTPPSMMPSSRMREGGHRPEAFAAGRREVGAETFIMIEAVAMVGDVAVHELVALRFLWRSSNFPSKTFRTFFGTFSYL